MAIALEADFRSLNTSLAADSPDRKPAKAGSGEAFASSLARARDAEAADTPAVSPEATTAAMALVLPADIAGPAVLPESDLVDAAAAEPLGADAAAAILKSEIVLDRQIVREGVEAQAEIAPGQEAGTDAASPPRVQPASTTEATASAAAGTALTADNEPRPPAEEMSKITAQAAAQPVHHVADASRAPVPAPTAAPDEIVAALPAIAAVPGASPAPASAASKAPVARQTHQTEAAAQPDASAILPRNGEQLAPPNAQLAETEVAPLLEISGKGAPLDAAGLNSTTVTGTQTLAAVAAPATPQATAATPSLVPSAPAFAVVTASPAQIVDIVTKTADDGQSDRIVVQLDPPELGRVSIDFKFDAQGLQQVTITSETPEAMRQLRQMHLELVHSLERHGIGSENLSFQHQQQGSPQSPPQNPFARAAALGDVGAASLAVNASTDSIPGARTLPGGRLDIRL